MGPITGQNGAVGLTDRVREAFRSGFLLCVGWSLAMAVVLAVLAPLLAPAFIPDAVGQAAMRHYLWIVPISVWGYGVVMTAAAGFNGLSKPAPGLIMTLGRSVGLMIGLTWLGGTLWGPGGAFVGLATANVISGAVVAAWTLRRALPRTAAPAPTAVVVPATPEPAILDAATVDR
jgi:Na+-driven multidrug efflux pump